MRRHLTRKYSVLDQSLYDRKMLLLVWVNRRSAITNVRSKSHLDIEHTGAAPELGSWSSSRKIFILNYITMEILSIFYNKIPAFQAGRRQIVPCLVTSGPWWNPSSRSSHRYGSSLHGMAPLGFGWQIRFRIVARTAHVQNRILKNEITIHFVWHIFVDTPVDSTSTKSLVHVNLAESDPTTSVWELRQSRHSNFKKVL